MSTAGISFRMHHRLSEPLPLANAGVVTNSVRAAEGIKAKLFKILGESEPLTSSEIWAKAEVRVASALLAHCCARPSCSAYVSAFTPVMRV